MYARVLMLLMANKHFCGMRSGQKFFQQAATFRKGDLLQANLLFAIVKRPMSPENLALLRVCKRAEKTKGLGCREKCILCRSGHFSPQWEKAIEMDGCRGVSGIR